MSSVEPNPETHQNEPISPELQEGVDEPAIDADSIVSRLRSADFYRDHRTALLGIGAVAAAIGVGVYELATHKGKEKISIGQADRHAAAKGILGLVHSSGEAVSVVKDAVTLDALGATKEIFGMDKDDKGKVSTSYPQERPADKLRYAKTLRRFGGYLQDVYSSRKDK